MNFSDLNSFNGKNIVLLQGPIGSFFKNLAIDLENHGATVYKINFNGGDWFYSNKHNSINFRKHPSNWRSFLEEVLLNNEIDCIFLFGDCRPIHVVALQVASKYRTKIGVFEEGYVRPNFITLEIDGVNFYSNLPRSSDFYKKQEPIDLDKEVPVGYSFSRMAKYAMVYYAFAILLKPFFKDYRHHRPIRFKEAYSWLVSFKRKWHYKIKERGYEKHLTSILSKRYYLMPLQVYNDAQIHTHSDFSTVEQFIRHVVQSFAKYAPKDTHLVIKHHPMDRGYNDYTEWLEQLEFLYDIHGRVHYIHDQHLPTLLAHSIGTIVVNSTVGLSALFHHSPLKVCGRAIYDIPGLTYQDSLDHFWIDAPDESVNMPLYYAFRNYLIANTQINGNFYKPLSDAEFKSGILWNSTAKVTNPEQSFKDQINTTISQDKD